MPGSATFWPHPANPASASLSIVRTGRYRVRKSKRFWTHRGPLTWSRFRARPPALTQREAPIPLLSLRLVVAPQVAARPIERGPPSGTQPPLLSPRSPLSRRRLSNMSDGLDTLKAKREAISRRQQRRPPPPRSPRQQTREDQDVAPAAAPKPVESSSNELPATTSTDPDPQSQPNPRPRKASQLPPAPKRQRPGLTQIYIDRELEEWLWDVKAAAATARAGVPISAVVRRALRDLMTHVTPEQLVREIAEQPSTVEPAQRGRPRR